MTVDFIGPAAEALLNWRDLNAEMVAGHARPMAQIKDMFLYQGKNTLLNRAAWIDGLGQLVKVATVFPGNAAQHLPTIGGAVNLFDDATGALIAVIDFHLVTKWKTAGDSLLAARSLARPESRKILIVGAGTVARSMIDAYRAGFQDPEFRVWARNPEAAALLGQPVAPDLAEAVAWADIICTATMSEQPLIKGEWLQPGQHLDLIGAYKPSMREVDDTAMSRARVFVDSRATTLGHIGELRGRWPLRKGAW